MLPSRSEFTAIASSPSGALQTQHTAHNGQPDTVAHDHDHEEVTVSLPPLRSSPRLTMSALSPSRQGNGTSSNSQLGTGPEGIELSQQRRPSFSQTIGATPPPQTLPEALEQLAAAQADIAMLQQRLDAAQNSHAFAGKGADHSGRMDLDIERSHSHTRDAREHAFETAGALRSDLEDQEAQTRVVCGCIELGRGNGGHTMSLEQYFQTPVHILLFRRLPWLVGLLLLQSFSASILHRYDEYLSAHLVFSFFIPMIVGTGGNAGNQCSVMVTRALALGMADSEVWRVVKKETPTALATAIVLAFFGFVRVVLEYPHDKNEAAAIAITLGISILISIILGIAFSYGIGLLNRCDPADGAAPLLTSVSDLLGIALLCGIATSMVK